MASAQESETIVELRFEESYASISRTNDAIHQDLAFLENSFSFVELAIGDGDDDAFWNA
jgi:hypothetical protein